MSDVETVPEQKKDDWNETPTSSNIAAFRWDEEKYLWIRFKDSGLYRFKDFPKELYLKMQMCESVGKFFHQFIKNQFETERMDKPGETTTD